MLHGIKPLLIPKRFYYSNYGDVAGGGGGGGVLLPPLFIFDGTNKPLARCVIPGGGTCGLAGGGEAGGLPPPCGIVSVVVFCG